MPMSPEAAKDQITELLKIRESEMSSLKRLSDYRLGRQTHPQAIEGMPAEVRRFIELARVNMIELAVEIPTQSLYVEGYRPNVAGEEDEAEAWLVWQANRMDSRQTAVHRGAFTYGVSYLMVLPGDPVPVMTPHSPKSLTVVYGEDYHWPYAALQSEQNGDFQTLTLYDAEAQYRFTTEGGLVHIETSEYDGPTDGRVPVVRFLNIVDIDDEIISEVERLIPIQDQIDLTTFGLMVTQHYQAFLQRYIIGWEANTEIERRKASASRLWTFDDPEVTVGQFNQAQLDGYLRSREDTAQLLAVISQTPPHHLLGDLINLSAEALAAAESGHRRKIRLREVTFGESWEQALELVEVSQGLTGSVDSQVRWADTEARSLAQTVDALGKMAEMLGIPPEALWERIPGTTQQDLARWKRLAAESDSLGQLTSLLTGQGLAPAPPPAPFNGGQQAPAPIGA